MIAFDRDVMPADMPRSRTAALNLQPVERELLIYDERTHRAFCLNPLAAAVWQLADGTHDLAALAIEAGRRLDAVVTEEAVTLAIAQLRQDGLVEPALHPVTVVSRRAALMKLGAGAALMLPAVTMIMTPTAAQAYNGCVNCTTSDSGEQETGTPERRSTPTADRTAGRQDSVRQSVDSAYGDSK